MADAGSLDTGYGDLMANQMGSYESPQAGTVGQESSNMAFNNVAPTDQTGAPSQSGTGGGNLAVNMGDPSSNQAAQSKANPGKDASSSKKQSLSSDLKNTGNAMAATLSAPGPSAPQIQMPQSSGPQQLGGAAPQMILTHPNLVYSDINLKTNIKPTSVSDINEFVRSLPGPSSFDYKDIKNGSHTEGGLMAQNLLKSKIGASTIVKTNKGLAVDVNKLTPIMTSVLTHKIKMLEAKIENALQTRFKGKK